MSEKIDPTFDQEANKKNIKKFLSGNHKDLKTVIRKITTARSANDSAR